MSKIFDQLYLGSKFEASNLEWLQKNYVTHIVNCAIELPAYFVNSFSYLNLKLDDVPSQTIYHVLEKSFNFIIDAISKGGTVFVHCAAGISRSVSIIIYFIMKSKEITFHKAFEFVKSKRPIANPNQGFVMQLISVSPEIKTYRHEVIAERSQEERLYY
jgi:protein-tyrosine phosphatase